MRKKMLRVAIIALITIIVIVGLIMLLLQDKPGEMMKKAMEMRDNNRTIEAADQFGRVALQYPDSRYADTAVFERGFTYYVIAFPRATDEDKILYIKLAQKSFETLVKEYPESELIDETRVYLGEISFALGEYQKAIENFEAAALHVKDPAKLQEIYHNLAQCYDTLGNIDKAIYRQKQIIDQNLGGRYYENAYISLARYYRIAASSEEHEANQDHTKIIELLDDLLNSGHEVSPLTKQEALLIMAHSLLELKNFDRARTVIDELGKYSHTPTNRALIDDYKDRLQRQSMMGKR